ncbi:uncharacterized protein CC84DRAFT_1168394 [Paraphaeosphaeria sporulosa]|uniref:Uncharacterized protein n=1 Tax=Paraphaeosphaeria sporulosa TaxID=1460663 RepID=A0A177C0E6_9PLEO|nr:uncharacterized protein CC84DRAFT_1168394 [Paraphaeosphaeria sporulosa]OAG00278.1 hypothetical protein CC84DRAFT_1168394 [Paraphaeosphaeria sporulosa]
MPPSQFRPLLHPPPPRLLPTLGLLQHRMVPSASASVSAAYSSTPLAPPVLFLEAVPPP